MQSLRIALVVLVKRKKIKSISLLVSSYKYKNFLYPTSKTQMHTTWYLGFMMNSGLQVLKALILLVHLHLLQKSLNEWEYKISL